MKYRLSLALAALAAAFLAGCATGPAKSNDYVFARTSGGPDCRRFAQPGDAKIQIYCKQSQPDRLWPTAPAAQASGDVSCRRLATSITGGIRVYCGNSARWDEFDARAVNAGVTCRWMGYSHGLSRAPQEVCLDGNQWVRAEANRRSRPVDSGVRSWSSGGYGNSGSDAAYATSYGYFPAGGAIGQ